MNDVPSDRRRAERVDINSAFSTFGDAIFVSNLSEYGVFVQSNRVLPLGTDIELQFTVVLEDPVVLKGRGRVVRHGRDPNGMGVEFTDLDPEMILRINDVVMRERPRELGPPIEDAGSDPSSDTMIVSPAELLLRTEDLTLSPLGSTSSSSTSEDPEAATTLMNLKPVDVEIIEDDEDLPEDDGGPISPGGSP